MPTRRQPQATPDGNLDLPPPYTLVSLGEDDDAFAHAAAIAGEQGAGTLVFAARGALADFALVLEPDEPLRTARRAFYAAMSALADALASFAQPETAIVFEWPDAINVNGGLVGGGRLAWPRQAGEDEPPPWLVFGGMIRVFPDSLREPGLDPLSTTLADEGFDIPASGQLVESFSRHFMVLVDSWKESGFGPVGNEYLTRLKREQGVRRDIDETGDLLVRRMGKTGVERKSLLAALAAPSWREPETGKPRL